MTRRELLAATAGVPFAATRSWAAPDEGTLEPLNRFPRMVQERFVALVREAEARRLAKLEALRSAEDARGYCERVRADIRRCFGEFPEKTPLNARITGTVERDRYRIENLIFESRPGFLVTANLYVPKGAGPFPGVIGTCGHTDNGKAGETYQAFSQGLARQGYMVLLYDPIGQGERLQYVDEDFQSRLRPGTREHLMAGNQQFLVGDFIGAWRAWDGVRALDYLLTRDEVDRERIGVTGNSGGGTMTTWLCGLDDRWTMAAPSCFVTTFRRNLENELPADTEQCPPGVIAAGLDHEDFLAAMAPKPVIILAKEKDFFDARGAEDAYGRLKRLYRLLGAEENIGLFIGDSYHGFSQENREAMYGWFNRHSGMPAIAAEPALHLEEDATLWAAPRGQVAALESRTIFSFTAEKARAQAGARRTGPLVERVSKALRIERRADPPPYARTLRPLSGRGYPKPFAAHYAVETEPGVQAIVVRLHEDRLMSRPPRGAARAVLYVADRSADQELREEALVRELIEKEPASAFFAMDPRGIGESQPDTCGENGFDTPYGSDYFYASHSLMLDRPYVGQKTADVLAVCDWLSRYGHEEIHLAGKGWGSLPAAYAALLSDRVAQVTLAGALESYLSIAESEEYGWPLSSFVPAVFASFDLPEVYEALRRERGLRLV